MTQPVNAIWIGDRMGPIHAACLKSFLTCGHDVILHAYQDVVDAPKGVTVIDARKLMREDEIVRHRNSGSLALASDVYRYRIMASDMGAYIDCDVLCVKPLPDDEFLFGWEEDRRVGSAVLRFPAASPAMSELRAAADDPFYIPPWSRRLKLNYLKTRKALGMPLPVARQRWGAIGPDLVTHVVKAHGLAHKIRPIDAFYPVHYYQTALLNDPGISVGDLTTPRTHAIHLWHNRLPKDGYAADGILDRLVRSR
jgi:hypothetical protein